MAAENQQFDSVDPSISSNAGYLSEQGELRFIVVGKTLFKHQALQVALKHFAALVLYTETGVEYLEDADSDTVFIVEDFSTEVFDKLYADECRIVAPPVIIRAAMNNEDVPYFSRPVYCSIMEGVVICCSGLKKKEDMANLANLVHHMGGKIRQDCTARVTHLVSARTGGHKYRAAVGFGIPIMSIEWVYKCWECRDDPAVSATDAELMKNKLNPFSYCVLAFHGFTKEDMIHMEEVTVTNGGTCVDVGSPICTHLIINDRTVKNHSLNIQDHVHVVRTEWFWASIQMEACAHETIYQFENNAENSFVNFGTGCRRTPSLRASGGSKSNRRKRLRDNLAQLAQEGETPVLKNRRSNASDTARKSLSSTVVNETVTSDASTTFFGDTSGDQYSVAATIKDVSKLNPRQQTIMELFQTENNYVGILNTILKVFKKEIEKTDQPGGPILDPQESKLIFGGIPPIYEVHSRIRDELCETVSSSTWLVGRIFLKNADALSKSYPSFVNYFEKTTEAIQCCDRLKPRFHAFLKLCQNKAECGRQSLAQLMIRPVQRLPSILLILRDLLKRTDKSMPDYDELNRAITSIEEVMTHINEDKRRTEGHQMLFGIVNDIENCPPNLLSAHRVFIQKINAAEVSDEIRGKGTPLTLFVFNDSLEIAKNRTKGQGIKSPVVQPAKPGQRKSHKHLMLIPFSSIKRIVDIVDEPDCRDLFSLIVKTLGDTEEKLYSFMIGDETTKKSEFLTGLSKTICDSQCRADYETLLAAVEAHVLNIDPSDLLVKRPFAGIGKRVSRVLSLNKTPQNATMKRAMSSMIQLSTPSSRRDSTMSSSTLSSLGRASGSSYLNSLMSSNTTAESGDEGFDTDSYSGIVDMNCLSATPTLKRNMESQRAADTVSVGRLTVFPTPRLSISTTVRQSTSTTALAQQAPAAGLGRFGMRRNIATSTQSLVSAQQQRSQESASSPMKRPPMTNKCLPPETSI